MPNVAAYVRVSTDAQAEKDSPALQRDAIERWLKQHPEYETAAWYEDPGISGAVPLAGRPGGTAMLADAEAGKVDAVVCYAYDRLHRDLGDAIQVKTLLDDLGIRLFSVKEGALDDPFISNIRAVVAAEERRRIGQRSRDGSRTLAKEGRWLGGITPYGYQVRPDTSGTRRAGWLEADESPIPGLSRSPAEVVREIFVQAADRGRSCVEIAEALNNHKVPTRYAALDRNYVRGKRNQKVANEWGPGAVRRILTNTIYKGEHRYGKRNTKSKAKGRRRRVPELVTRAMPALVDVLTWEQAQATLKRNFIFNPRGSKRDYLLRGLLRCERCGRTYVGASTEDAKGGVRYICGGRFKHLTTNRTACTGAPIDWDIEAQVWADLVSLFTREDVVAKAYTKHLKHSQDHAVRAKKDAATITKRLKALDEEEQKLLTRFRKGGIKETALDQQLKDIDGERQTLGKEKERVEREATASAVTTAALDGARDFVHWVRDQAARPDLDFSTRRRIVEALIAGGIVRTVEEPVAVKKRVRTRVKTSFAVVEIGYRLGLAQTYRSESPKTYLTSAWPRNSYADYIQGHDGQGLENIRLADLEVTPEPGVMEKAAKAVTENRKDKGSLPRPA
jgi:site-specific DNA recombinase